MTKRSQVQCSSYWGKIGTPKAFRYDMIRIKIGTHMVRVKKDDPLLCEIQKGKKLFVAVKENQQHGCYTIVRVEESIDWEEIQKLHDQYRVKAPL